jgi:hypothetical protein
MKNALLLFFLIAPRLFAQLELVGQVNDAELKEALPFVNIGIPGEGIGTVTDQQGYFVLEIPSQFSTAYLQVSMIGFSSQLIAIKDIGEYITIDLSPEVTALKEVIVTDAGWEFKEVSNKTNSELLTVGFTSNNLGNEIAQFVRVRKNRPTLLKRFWLSVARNDIESVLLRFNVYIEEAGFPGKNILEDPIYIELPNRCEILEIDLSPYDIYVEDDFFISIEWIEDLGVEGLWFSAGVLGKPLYSRSASQDQWKIQKALSIGMGVEIYQQN